jgi:hypothetical protein
MKKTIPCDDYSVAQFSRDQIEFLAFYILIAALDRVESSVPDTVPLKHYRKHKDGCQSYASGAVEGAAFALACLFAQTIGDGMGTFDWRGSDQFLKVVEDFVAFRTSKKFKGLKVGEPILPRNKLKRIAKMYADDWAKALAENAVADRAAERKVKRRSI